MVGINIEASCNGVVAVCAFQVREPLVWTPYDPKEPVTKEFRPQNILGVDIATAEYTLRWIIPRGLVDPTALTFWQRVRLLFGLELR